MLLHSLGSHLGSCSSGSGSRNTRKLVESDCEGIRERDGEKGRWEDVHLLNASSCVRRKSMSAVIFTRVMVPILYKHMYRTN